MDLGRKRQEKTFCWGRCVLLPLQYRNSFIRGWAVSSHEPEALLKWTFRKKFVYRPVKATISRTGVGGDLRFRHQRTSTAILLLQKGWAGFTRILNSQTFHMAPAEQKHFLQRSQLSLPSVQWNSNTLKLVSGKETGFYYENQNLCMLNLQVSSLKLQMQTIFRWLRSSGLTTGHWTGECTFQWDLSRWPMIPSWSWGETVDSGYKGLQQI